MFASNEELFTATRQLIAELERDGEASAARDLRDGLAALSGLTDGWAAFLETLDAVERGSASRLAEPQRATLAAIRAAAHYAVHRRSPPWWRFR